MSNEENSNEDKIINEEEEKEEKKENEEGEKKQGDEEEKKENEEEGKNKNKKKEGSKKEKKKEEIKKDNKKEKIIKNDEKENKILENKLNITKEKKPIITNITLNPNKLNNLNENNNFTSRFTDPINRPYQSLQLLSNINNEMDSLSKTLNTKFSLYSSNLPSLYNSNFNLNYNDNLNSNYLPSFLNINYNYNNYDKEDFEIKELLIRANKIIKDNEIKLKLNNNNLNNNYNLNNSNGGVKKYENKITQYEENINKNENNNSNNISLNNNNSYLNYDFYKDKNNNYPDHVINNNLYTIQQSSNNFQNNYSNNNNINENYYKNRKQKSINNGIQLLNKKDFLNNNFEMNNNYKINDNIAFNQYQDYNKIKSQKNDGNSIDISFNNKTKKIEDLYKYTNNPRRKPMVYTQPDSFPLNKISSRNRHATAGNNKFKENSDKLTIRRDKKNLKKNSFLRSENEEINRAIDILNGKI